MERAELERELRAHHPDCYGWALSCCRDDPHSAEDVLHETYLRVLDGRARFRGESSFRTWLFGVIRLVARGARRRAMLRNVLLLRAFATEPPPLVEDAPPEAALRAALQRLPERQREVLMLVFYQDLTIAEAAQALGIALGTARAHYERGKAALRAALGTGGAP